MNQLANELEVAVKSAERELRSIGEEASSTKPAPAKWSPREILGHLIDSAANNHGRFVRGAIEEDLVFAGYAQNEWVTLQRYQERRWHELIDLWVAYNLHLAKVVAAIPDESLSRLRARHNFDRIAWNAVPAAEASSLGYFIGDYIAHMRHHLDQIRAAVN